MSDTSSSDVADLIAMIYSDKEGELTAAHSIAAPTSVAGAASSSISNDLCGRIPGSKTVSRGECSWFKDYLAAQPVYPSHKFCRVFRVPFPLYWIIHDELLEEEPRLGQQTDGIGRPGHSSHQKILCALRRLGSGLSFAQLYDMCRMSPESQRYYFNLFLEAMYERFGPIYLNREPTLCELHSIADDYEKEEFPGCIGCVDCMQIKWKNCPKEVKGQYRNPKEGKLATISCEAFCDHRLYCWHWFAGRCGTNNDITVVDNSPLFIDILNGNCRMTLPEGYSVKELSMIGSFICWEMGYTRTGEFLSSLIALL